MNSSVLHLSGVLDTWVATAGQQEVLQSEMGSLGLAAGIFSTLPDGSRRRAIGDAVVGQGAPRMKGPAQRTADGGHLQVLQRARAQGCPLGAPLWA